MTPLEIVQNKTFQKMRMADRMLYFVLLTHGSKKNGRRAWPSVETLTHEVGSSRNTVCQSIRNLVAAGLIIKETRPIKGTNKRRSEYTIIEKPELQSIPPRTPKKGTEYSRKGYGVFPESVQSIPPRTGTIQEQCNELPPGSDAAPISGEAAVRPEDALSSEVDPREREKLRRALLDFQGRHLQDRVYEQSAFGLKLKAVSV